MRILQRVAGPIVVSGAMLLCAQAATALQDCATCPEMVAIPAGTFVMGAAPGEEERENLTLDFRHRSAPQRTIAVKAFAAGRHEITRGQYRAFAQATGRSAEGCFVWAGADFELRATTSWRDPGFAQDDTHPATCVSWDDATAYTAWLSKLTARRYRLLTEAEWEYAARAGSTTSRHWGDNASCDFANGADRSTVARVPEASAWPAAECNDRHAYTAPVGSYRPNRFGLHYMIGNVEEWTLDCWRPDYSEPRAGDCRMRAVRGGSWLDAPVGLRSAYRVGSPPSVRVYRRGFRVAADL